MAGVLILTVAGIGLALALQHRPGWYRPYVLSESHLSLARMEALRVVDSISDRIVQGEPFEVVLSEDQLNIWLAGLEQIWPEAAKQVPRSILDPFVDFAPGRVRLAARVESEGWRAIVTTQYSINLSDDLSVVAVGLTSVKCGSMRIPDFVLATSLDRPIRVQGEDFPVASLSKGIQIRNRFVWPNGRRPFRLGAFAFEEDSVRLRIDPL